MQFTPEQMNRLFLRKLRNQELSLREYEERKLVLRSKPSKLIIELTQNCNFRCLMCPQSFYPQYGKFDPERNMALPLFDKVVKALFDQAYFVDLRGFGESTILPYWPDILDRLDDHPLINWHLVSNFSLPKPQIWERMARQGFLIAFSCDAATKETFEQIRVRSHFERILQNLEAFSSTVKSHGTGYVYMLVTIQRKNVHELPAIVELAHRYEVREVQFKMMVAPEKDQLWPHDEIVQDSQKEGLANSVSRSLDIAIELGVRLNLNDHELLKGADPKKVTAAASISTGKPRLNFPPENQAERWNAISSQVGDMSRVSVHKRCFKPFHYLYVSSDGKVGPCNHLMNPHMVALGDFKKNSFAKIWNGRDYQFFRATLLQAMMLDPRCNWCFQHRLED